MNGEGDEAEKIAKAGVPGPVCVGLQPFFEQLAGLAAVNRAFAVHFGELRPTATRIADAKLAPTLPALTTETAPTRLASAEPSPTARSARRDRPATEKRKPHATARQIGRASCRERVWQYV